MNIKGAIFDMDGTLLDSMYIWDTMASRYLKKHGIVPEEGLDQKFKVLTLEEGAEYFRQNYGISDSVENIVAEINEMTESAYQYEVQPLPDVEKVLQQLKLQGVKMCVATVTDEYLAEMALQQSGLRQYFDAIFTCAQVGASKHHPDIYEKALEFLGTQQAETFVFEDAFYAICTAKNAGFPTVAIYGASYEQHWEEMKQTSDIALLSYRDWEGFV